MLLHVHGRCCGPGPPVLLPTTCFPQPPAFTTCLHAPPFAAPQVMAGALLEQAETLLDRGIHPLRIAEGYEMACKVALQRMDDIATTFDFSADNHESLVKTCMTTLSSKM